MRHAIISLDGRAPRWIAEDLPAGWRVARELDDLAVLIEGLDDAPLPVGAVEIDPTTAALLLRAAP